MWRGVISILLGALLMTIGAALALNYRGIATKHIALAMGVVRPLTSSRKLMWEDEQLVRRRKFFVLLDRFIGVLMIPVGMVMLATGGQYLLRLA